MLVFSRSKISGLLYLENVYLECAKSLNCFRIRYWRVKEGVINILIISNTIDLISVRIAWGHLWKCLHTDLGSIYSSFFFSFFNVGFCIRLTNELVLPSPGMAEGGAGPPHNFSVNYMVRGFGLVHEKRDGLSIRFESGLLLKVKREEFSNYVSSLFFY